MTGIKSNGFTAQIKFVVASVLALLVFLPALSTESWAQDDPTPTAEATATPVTQTSPTETAVPLITSTPLPPTPIMPATAVPAPSVQPAPAVVNSYAGLCIGDLTRSATVRSAPSAKAKAVKTWWAGRRVLLYSAVGDGSTGFWYRVSDAPEVLMYVHSSVIRRVAAVRYEGARFAGRWVNVDVSQQVVTAYQGGVPVKVTLASTGTSKNPTDLGMWKIMWRLPRKDMKGGSLATGDYYDLKNVPYPQYFNSTGEALHGTYWHDDFGRPHSHGCVNLSTPMSQWFYGWASVGTPVYVHR